MQRVGPLDLCGEGGGLLQVGPLDLCGEGGGLLRVGPLDLCGEGGEGVGLNRAGLICLHRTINNNLFLASKYTISER